MLVCDFSPPFSLRGYARFDKEQLKQAIDNDQISSERLLGKGTLALTIDQGPHMQPYQGIVALDGSIYKKLLVPILINQSKFLPISVWLLLY